MSGYGPSASFEICEIELVTPRGVEIPLESALDSKIRVEMGK